MLNSVFILELLVIITIITDKCSNAILLEAFDDMVFLAVLAASFTLYVLENVVL